MATTKVTTGLITSLDATKLTGSIADARVPASAVTQHVTATDLTSVHQGIATLGLHMGVADNKAAFNLPNAFIDTFESDAGIATETTVDRNASEYVSSTTSTTVAPAYFTGNQQSVVTMTSNANIYNYTGSPDTTLGFNQIFDGDTTSTASSSSFVFGTGTQTTSGKYLRFEFTSPAKLITEATFYHHYSGSSAGLGTWQWQGSNDGSTWTSIGSNFTLTAPAAGQVLTELSGNTNYYTWYQMLGISGTISDYPYIKELQFKRGQIDTTTNATGTLVSTVQTAPVATTEVSGAILYTDDAGTNTLGTDLKIYMTANLQGTTPNWTGTTWTEASSYGTAQTFSGTTKQVKLGKTTVTSGTAVAMKAVWANQVAASSSAYVTGDRTSSITPTSAGITVNGSLSTLIDGNTATSNGVYFTASSPATDGSAYIRFQFSTARVITEAKYHTSTGGYANGTWRWQGSNTVGGASGYSNIGNTFVLGVGAEQLHTELNGNTTSYLYYQMTFVSGSVNSSEYQNEIEFKEGLNVTGKVAQLNGWAVNY